MTTPPNDLPPVDSVGTGFNYKRYTSLDTSTHYVYKQWRNSSNDWRTVSPASYNTIKVSKTDSTDWSDNDTTDTNPTIVDTTSFSNKVSLEISSGEIYRFALPNPSWGSGGGTGTEGTSTGTNDVSGTIVDNSTHYTFTVASTAPSTSGVVQYNVLKDDVVYGVITHTNGATNPMNVYLSTRSTSNWKLTIVSSTGLYQSSTLATLNNIRKKVHCNFW